VRSAAGAALLAGAASAALAIPAGRNARTAKNKTACRIVRTTAGCRTDRPGEAYGLTGVSEVVVVVTVAVLVAGAVVVVAGAVVVVTGAVVVVVTDVVVVVTDVVVVDPAVVVVVADVVVVGARVVVVVADVVVVWGGAVTGGCSGMMTCIGCPAGTGAAG
jgi:hypothetical protein